ncbi:hypothetical protein B0A48_02391 [Cryoendolithus antarcticus]|uniref:Uncharacterized protein n=1 Tax=Cryoendolithus antarcticus TaxID=1507870 RepID=A0A1V8TNH3_9PEZI|nr:hypothetical protein B0A48_02391 [Cryoendolithus antarcticus]
MDSQMQTDPANTSPPKKGSRILRHNYDKFWLIPSSHRIRIVEFVDKLIVEPELRTKFQSSFINYCYRQITRLQRADTKWSPLSTKEMAEHVLAVLSKDVTDFGEFTGLMEQYAKGSWISGPTKGLAPTEAPIEKAAVRRAQEALHSLISDHQRRNTTIALPGSVPGGNHATGRRKKLRARIDREADEEAMADAAQSVNQLALGPTFDEEVDEAVEEMGRLGQ